MNVPEDLRYAETHEWVRMEDAQTALVGITDHAQAELTDIVFVELPNTGAEVRAKQAIAVVESVKAASDIYTPLSGTVLEINSALEADPGLLNREPFGAGWLFKLKVSAPDELSVLKDPAAYRAQIS